MRTEEYLERMAEINYRDIATAIMFALMDCPEGFTEHDFFAEARRFEIPPEDMRRLSSRLFTEFQKAGYIRRAGDAWERAN